MRRDQDDIARAQVANAAGDRLHNVITGDATLTAASEIPPTDAFISLRLGAHGWKRRRSLLPDPPEDGSTVRASVPQAEIEAIVRAAPTGIAARRAWYLYESLTRRTLDVEDAPSASAIDLLEPKSYFTGKPRLSKRHRVRDNLLGTGRFCPVMRRTKSLIPLFTSLNIASVSVSAYRR